MTEGPVAALLVRLTLPMILAVLSTMAYLVAETWLIGQVGPEALTAASFTFPVNMIIISLAIGLGAGTSAVVARAQGAGEPDVSGLVTDAMLLTAITGIVTAGLGAWMVGPLFHLLGAPEPLIPMIAGYLYIWLPAIVLFMIAMVGLNAGRASGDGAFQAIAMAGAAAMNLVLGRLLILSDPGLGLGLRGAAFANLVTYGPFLVAASWRLRSLGLLSTALPSMGRFVANSRRVLRVGGPAAAGNTIIPISSAVITAILAAYGAKAVGGFGMATRVEALSMVLFFALSAVMNPFTGQNSGAGRMDRVRTAMSMILVFCLGFGVAIAGILFVSAPWIAAQFTADPEVAHAAVAYLRLVPLSYGGAGLIAVITAAFNGLNRPMAAVALSVARTLLVNVPVAYVGGRLFGVPGVFAGVCVANLVVGAGAFVWVQRVTAVDHPQRSGG